jgi:hypothetical protein
LHIPFNSPDIILIENKMHFTEVRMHSLRSITLTDKENQNPSFVLEKVQTLKFENRPIPQLQDPHDVLVRVKFTGICGSDVSACPTKCIDPRVHYLT